MFYCNTLVRDKDSNGGGGGGGGTTTVINQGKPEGIPFTEASRQFIIGSGSRSIYRSFANKPGPGEILFYDADGSLTRICSDIATIAFNRIDNVGIDEGRLFSQNNIKYVSLKFDNDPDQKILLTINSTVIGIDTITLNVKPKSVSTNFIEIVEGETVRKTLYFANQAGRGDGTIQVGSSDDVESLETTDTIIFDSSGFILTRPETDQQTVNVKNYFQDFFNKKPLALIDPVGIFDSNDQRVELTWKTPPQQRNAFVSAAPATRSENVFTPSLRDPSASPYYPLPPKASTGQELSDPPYNASDYFPNTLNLIVPSVSTGFYSDVPKDPSFNDLNYLPYHQHLGVDYRYIKNSDGTLTNWKPITPRDLGFQGSGASNPGGHAKGEQHLWYQTLGLYIKGGDDGDIGEGEGDYSPNTSPGPGGSAGDYIYQLENNKTFSSITSAGGYQFRAYLTNNSDEVLTATEKDKEFDSEDPPYWNYCYFPDNSQEFLTFGIPGDATPPRVINFSNISYNSFRILGSNQNAHPADDASGSPAPANATNQNTAATYAETNSVISITFANLSTYNFDVKYGFDLSFSYDTSKFIHGEQAIFPTLLDTTPQPFTTLLTRNNEWDVNDINTSSNSIVFPGYTYTFDNYFMNMFNSNNSQRGPTAYTVMHPNSNGQGGGGDSLNTPETPYPETTIPPPDRDNGEYTYENYLSKLNKNFNDNDMTSSWVFQTGPARVEEAVFRRDESSQFESSVNFFELTTEYTFRFINSALPEVHGVQQCVCNSNVSTSGWNGGINGETYIGTALYNKDLASFQLQVSGNSFSTRTATTTPVVLPSIPNIWITGGGSHTGTETNGTLTITRSGGKDAYTSSINNIEDERLQGWYLGVDLESADGVINLTNYGDIGAVNGYSPYTFTIKQFIGGATTQAGGTREYKLYIGEKPTLDITWTPPQPVPLPSQVVSSHEFFGLKRIFNPITFELSGSLNNLNPYWKRGLNIMYNITLRYRNTTPQPSSNNNIEITSNTDVRWDTTSNSSQSINENMNLTPTILANKAAYSRDTFLNPTASSLDNQFYIAANYHNNVARLPQFNSLIYEFSFQKHLWWDYTWGASAPWNGSSGNHFPPGFFEGNARDIYNLQVGPFNIGSTNQFDIQHDGSQPSQSVSVAAQNAQGITGGMPYTTTNFTFITTAGWQVRLYPLYNHTNTIKYNQSMWADDGFKGYFSTTNNRDPYIDYSIYQDQTKNYNFSAPQDAVSITYGSGVYGPVGTFSGVKSLSNVKWLFFTTRMAANLIPSNGFEFTVKGYGPSMGTSANPVDLSLGDDYFLFVREWGSDTYRLNTASPQYTSTIWLDAAAKGALKASMTSNFGANGSGIYNTRTGNTYKLNILGGSANELWHYFRIGLKEDFTITKITIQYATT